VTTSPLRRSPVRRSAGSRAIAPRRCKCVARTTAGLRPLLLTAHVHRRKAHSVASAIIVRHGELTPAALVYVRLCIGKVAIPSANERARTRAGGRNPPVVSLPRWRRRSPTLRRQSPTTLRNRSCKCVSRTTAGSRPPLLTAGVHRRKTHSHASRKAHSVASAIIVRHGELTPAALVYVRLCIGKVAIPSANERARTRAGGRNPPVVSLPRWRRRSPTHRRQSPTTLRNRSCKCISRTTASSRPPLLTAHVHRRKTHSHASRKAHSVASAIIVRHGGLRPPLLVRRAVSVCEDVRNRSCKDATGTRKENAHVAPTNAVASASPDRTAGSRPPLLVLRSDPADRWYGGAIPEPAPGSESGLVGKAIANAVNAIRAARWVGCPGLLEVLQRLWWTRFCRTQKSGNASACCQQEKSGESSKPVEARLTTLCQRVIAQPLLELKNFRRRDGW